MAQVFRGDDLATIEFCGSKRALWAQSDRMSAGGTLEELWKSGRQGNLCPLEQVRAIALRDAYTDLPGALPKSGGQAALLSAIAERVTKIGGGHPSKEAIRLLLERYDADPSGWYPGKSDQAKFGPSPVLNGAKRRCIATAAMAMKQEGMEPTYKTEAQGST